MNKTQNINTQKYLITIKNQSPIIIKEREYHTNYDSTLNYIPGTSLFGALAKHELFKKVGQGEISQQLLNAIFQKGALNASKNGDNNTEGIQNYASVADLDVGKKITPPNIYCSDFLPTKNAKSCSTPPLMSLVVCRADQDHIGDSTLFYLRKWAKQNNLIRESTVNKFMINAPPRCNKEECGAPLKKRSSSLTYQNPLLKKQSQKRSNSKYIKTQTKLFQKTGIAINECINSVAQIQGKGALFVQEMLEADQYFQGIITIEESMFDENQKDEKASRKLIKDLFDSLRVGARKNAGFGRIKLEHMGAIDEQRLIEKYKRNFKRQQEIIPCNDCLLIPFYLQSHVPPTAFNVIKKELDKFGTGKIQLLFKKSQPKRIKIRNQAIRKWISLNVVERGTVGFLQIEETAIIKQNDQDKMNKLFNTLKNWEINRIGEYSHKGLGEIRFMPDIFYDLSII